jgi:HAD superfamily hydrolase (TIGR01459 family)
MADAEDFWGTLDPGYRLILCDLWGVVHDGYDLFPGAVERLRGWRAQGRFVLLITNAPRSAEAIEDHLRRLGLPRDCWDAITSGGEAGIAAVNRLNGDVGFLGTASDRVVLEKKGVQIAANNEFTDLVCTGLEERRPHVADYVRDLANWAQAGVRMHCLNPDRIVIHGGVALPCAGAIADEYEKLGGVVSWYGKPYPAIYGHALSIAGNPPPGAVLAVGDGLQTDILGAARTGFDAVFVTGGIHGGQPFPPDFAQQHGLGDWRPVAVVDSLLG